MFPCLFEPLTETASNLSVLETYGKLKRQMANKRYKKLYYYNDFNNNNYYLNIN